ncbi:hypothetical protein VOLCADRAFT_106952 [Volvox carteri f. nagariensis]|uniref:Uncharacterized protein n=1 Tax=Volvox carteri f. nagariensis TaxID=3068 RepID=D8UAV3_VOLCA|nr:uncharacterized protein VOLCADRAFT_106952 [Volvox carteri f. nagariensis]EFJ43223.1 hypothetical protein VOLCADRAFT_106952 [Volvox carteri f. nagariensis]|eukprot:XP_002955798.1 hypothetical protein VOLCADRAFT_106952 [Volvox carteri f. nagariensis]
METMGGVPSCTAVAEVVAGAPSRKGMIYLDDPIAPNLPCWLGTPGSQPPPAIGIHHDRERTPRPRINGDTCQVKIDYRNSNSSSSSEQQLNSRWRSKREKRVKDLLLTAAPCTRPCSIQSRHNSCQMVRGITVHQMSTREMPKKKNGPT